MPIDDFGVDRELFRSKALQYEQTNGLDEGAILKAIEKLDAQIRQEEDNQASMDLEIATNPNVHPEVAAKYAQNAMGVSEKLTGGPEVITGAQMASAKPILKRMSKAMTDPNLPDDIREQSLAQDKYDLEQITIKSTTRGGVRGVEVTGAIPAESPIFQKPDRGPVRFEGGRGTFVREEDAPFFPEPEQKEQGVEEFMQTLEPLRTIRGGAAGERELNDIQQRNAIRIAEFRARQSKPVTLGPGQSIYDVRDGEATRIATAPSVQKPTKGPTSIEQALLDPNLSKERKNELISMKRAMSGKGWSGTFTSKDGSTFTFGQDTEDKLGIDKLTPGARTQVQREIRDAQGRLEEFKNLAKDPRFSPEENLTFYGAGLAKLGDFLDEAISPSVSRFFGLQDNVEDWNAFKALTENLFTAWRRSVTGVAFRPEEETALRKAFPSTKDGPTAYRAKLSAVIELNNRIVNRLQTLGPGDKIDVLDELSAVDAQGARTSPGGGGGKLSREQALQIYRAVGGDKEKARQLATSFGYTL